MQREGPPGRPARCAQITARPAAISPAKYGIGSAVDAQSNQHLSVHAKLPYRWSRHTRLEPASRSSAGTDERHPHPARIGDEVAHALGGYIIGRITGLEDLSEQVPSVAVIQLTGGFAYGSS